MTIQTKEELANICGVIRNTVETEQIYLFGSYAYGQPNEHSDYDLYVVIPDGSLRPTDAVKRIRKALFPLQTIPLDVIVSRAGEFRQRTQGASLERQIAREGSCSMTSGLSKEWLDFAEMDLRSAEYLLNMHPVPIEIICYHCEQAAEKLLKGVLVSYDVEPPRTHDLVQLCKLCAEKNEDYAQLADACVELSPYGVQVRYPSNMELEETDMQCALKECREMDAFVRQRLCLQ